LLKDFIQLLIGKTVDLYLHFARDQQVYRGASVSLPEQCFPALEVDCAERFEKPFARALECIYAHRHREIDYAPEGDVTLPAVLSKSKER